MFLECPLKGMCFMKLEGADAQIPSTAPSSSFQLLLWPEGLPTLSSSEQGECGKEQMLENCLWPAPSACEDSSSVAAASPSTWQVLTGPEP